MIDPCAGAAHLVEDDPGNSTRVLGSILSPHALRRGLPERWRCVAYYPTRIPFHHRSAWLKDSDPFGELALVAANWAWSLSRETRPARDL